jgi:FkbM family methyltransferase
MTRVVESVTAHSARRIKWYDDKSLVSALPRRYRIYAIYSRLLGDPGSRKVRGGSFILRALARASAAAGLSTVAHVRGRDGLEVVTDFSDERVLEVIHEIRGENPEYGIMVGLLSEGDTFVDVGANFGTFSLLASRIVGQSGKVIAIEPQVRLASYIAESIRLSECGNCELAQVACGSSSTRSSLLVPTGDSGRAGFFPDFSARDRHEMVIVPVASLDGILRDIRCPGSMLIKIDVEGSELDVLQGAVETITSRRPAIIVEINPWSAKAARRRPGAVIEFLRELGYRSFSTTSSFPRTVDPRSIALDRQGNIVALCS